MTSNVLKTTLYSIVAALFMPLTGIAEIYRWTDEDGKVHYGNRDEVVHSKDAEKVVVRDKYIIPHIARGEPIAYEKNEPNRPVAVTSVILDMPESEREGVRIGRITCGPRLIDIYWDKGSQSLVGAGLGEAIRNEFAAAGYTAENALGSVASGGSLELRGELTNIKINSCPRARRSSDAKSAALVHVTWTLYDPMLDKELISVDTRGSHNGLDGAYVADGAKVSFEQAMAMSVANLLAQEKFVALVGPADLASMKTQFTQALDVEYRTGNGLGSFYDVVEDIKRNSVVIKTEHGHGSGVLINDQGYVLTNAHVVGDENTFTVTSGNSTYSGKLVRKERVRDVALIQLQDYSGSASGVTIAQKVPKVGDELFVVGTPLKVEFQQTVTKGIVSAYRNINGMPFIQTDAAINPGNSGGPVLDKNGELVALAVSGMFTNYGASLNINYLIPIEDAVTTLNIAAQGSLDSVLARVMAPTRVYDGNTDSDDNTVLGKIKLIAVWLDQWLDRPIARLY